MWPMPASRMAATRRRRRSSASMAPEGAVTELPDILTPIRPLPSAPLRHDYTSLSRSHARGPSVSPESLHRCCSTSRFRALQDCLHPKIAPNPSSFPDGLPQDRADDAHLGQRHGFGRDRTRTSRSTGADTPGASAGIADVTCRRRHRRPRTNPPRNLRSNPPTRSAAASRHCKAPPRSRATMPPARLRCAIRSTRTTCCKKRTSTARSASPSTTRPRSR